MMNEGEVYVLHSDDDDYLVRVVKDGDELYFQFWEGERIHSRVTDHHFDDVFCYFIGPLDEIAADVVLSPRYDGDVGALAKKLDCFSWCDDCEDMTINAPGMMYSGKPFSEREWQPEQRYHPDYNRLLAEYRNEHSGNLDWLKVNVWSLSEVVPTEKQLADRFFACCKCGREKFWAWGYRCPRCDSDSYLILSIGEAHYNYGKAMEFGGTPMDWDEVWHCLECGLDYEIDNSNC